MAANTQDKFRPVAETPYPHATPVASYLGLAIIAAIAGLMIVLQVIGGGDLNR